LNAVTKRVVVLIVGWSFIVLGIAGLFLPVLQGILFLLIGLIILSSEYVWAQKLLKRAVRHFPSLEKHLDSARVRAEAWMTKLAGK
jgi:uncharacterized membrane protein YbaN (DUF454 family)